MDKDITMVSCMVEVFLPTKEYSVYEVDSHKVTVFVALQKSIACQIQLFIKSNSANHGRIFYPQVANKECRNVVYLVQVTQKG